MAATDTAKRLDASAASIHADLAKPPPAAPSELYELTGLTLSEGAASFVLLLAFTFTVGGALATAAVMAARRPAQDPGPAQTKRPWFAAVGDVQVPSPGAEATLSTRDAYASALATLKATLFPEGDVHSFASECVRSSRGKSTRMQDIFQHYRAWCQRQVPPRPPVEPEEFGSIFKSLCEKHGANIRRVGERFYADGLVLKLL